MKAITLGILSSFFFAFTFILNRQMSITGGSWIWSSSLRYIFMLPILFLIMIIRNELRAVLIEISENPIGWLLWSTVGFGLFYAPISFASDYGPSWLVAGTWQFTIIAGVLLSPLFYETKVIEKREVKVRNKIPLKALGISAVIILGIIFMQAEQVSSVNLNQTMAGVIPVIIAAFAYPLGNRKMMELCKGKLNTYQRVFGMTVCSMPFWIILSIHGYTNIGLPNQGQILQSFVVAICSGIIATILFFKATDISRNNSNQLAAVEATQAGEIIFTLLIEVLIFHERLPSVISIIGVLIVAGGMVLHSVTSNKVMQVNPSKDSKSRTKESRTIS